MHKQFITSNSLKMLLINNMIYVLLMKIKYIFIRFLLFMLWKSLEQKNVF